MPVSNDIKISRESRQGSIQEPIFKKPQVRSSRLRAIVVIAIAAVIVLGIAGLALKRFVFLKQTSNIFIGDEGESYYAVFLTNGQVYFGHLYDRESEYPFLCDIYYLRLNQSLHQQKEGEVTVLDKPELALIKLGTELHGPIDEMRINRDHILFIETLREDSKVVEAIKQYKKQAVGD
ncbi:hypothetical protein KKD19_01730 [Patescibacteria group bacterium]|nr:hypothetical protein [Patescibacteria group bacterium]MBU4511948.1 hypothetical protein [Patescibacteria group bacterium]MCG2692703.1 hypothetical protein [Candidatus Parcubacteria bacterium]